VRQRCERNGAPSRLSAILGHLRSISKADFLIWGGGNMLQDQSSALDVPYHLIDVFWARMLGIPVILFGVEIGPITTKLGSLFSMKGMKAVDLILIRNGRSERVLKKIGVRNPNIHVTADPAFLVAPDDRAFARVRDKYGIQDHRPIIGVAPRKAFYKTSGLVPATVRMKLKMMPHEFHSKFLSFKRRMAQICDHLANRFDAQILFMPMDVSGNARDDLVCKEIIDLMTRKEHAIFIEPGLTASEMTALIEHLDLVVSQRLHALILSCSMNTPMIGIASKGAEDKCRVFMQDIGQEDLCMDIESIIDESHADNLYRVIEGVWESRREIKQKLKPKADELRAKSMENVNLLNHYLRSRLKETAYVRNLWVHRSTR